MTGSNSLGNAVGTLFYKEGRFVDVLRYQLIAAMIREANWLDGRFS